MPDARSPRPVGRPPLFEAPAEGRIYVNVTPAQRRALQDVAREERVSVSVIIRRAVNRFTADYGERSPFSRTR